MASARPGSPELASECGSVEYSEDEEPQICQATSVSMTVSRAVLVTVGKGTLSVDASKGTSPKWPGTGGGTAGGTKKKARRDMDNRSYNDNTSSLPDNLGPFVLKPCSFDDPSTLKYNPSHKGKKSRLLEGLAAQGGEDHPDRIEHWVSGLCLDNLHDPELALPLPSLPNNQKPPQTDFAPTANFDTGTLLDQTAMPKNKNSDKMRHHGKHAAPVDDARAIRGNFIPVSHSLGSVVPSPSTDRSQGVYLQFSLTETQMDRLTAALSQDEGAEQAARGRHMAQNAGQLKQTTNNENKQPSTSMRSRSPTKIPRAANTLSRDRSHSPVKHTSGGRNVDNLREAYEFEASRTPKSPEAQKGYRTPNQSTTPVASTSSPAWRDVRHYPTPIDTEIAQKHAKRASMHGREQVPAVTHNPLDTSRPPFLKAARYALSDDTSSVYSQGSDEVSPLAPISPLRIKKEDFPKHISVLQGYNEWRQSPCYSDPESKNSQHVHFEKGFVDDHPGTANGSSSGGTEGTYNPLAPYLMAQNSSAPTRMASKILIGQNGWLEDTSKKQPEPTTSPSRKGGFFDRLVEKAKEMVDKGSDTKSQRKSRESDKSQPGSGSRSLAISLNPREQSLLYCELEFALATALNEYVKAQLNGGRLDPDKLRKIADGWHQRGRPKVVSFRYDLETQIELVKLHVNDFMFYGRAASNPSILGILDTMKVDARAMRIRTFCQPDTVIAKQLLDAQNLFDLIGAPEHQQIQLAEIIAFVKAAMERERLLTQQQESQRESAATGLTPLRHTKSQSGETWHAANQVRRTASYGVIKEG
ncbi:hypothetical protein B0T24DRAFT_595028 [Lasiosphaeria ovina]|uniref:Uncharacterized protein n=1 Tax=Lasiosphaeria ovina TaxID=92902 RepID=A0AAE0N585_9PEZI|nr:hypothetical protein B0T24DRAFT_595028 [Lasiosphaeria ovina]